MSCRINIKSIRNIVEVSCEIAYTILIDEPNVYAFSDNEYGKLGLRDIDDRNVPTLIPNIKAINVSYWSDHTILIDVEHNVYISKIWKPNIVRYYFGDNSYGQLGLGDEGDGTDRNMLTLIPGIKVIQTLPYGEVKRLGMWWKNFYSN